MAQTTYNPSGEQGDPVVRKVRRVSGQQAEGMTDHPGMPGTPMVGFRKAGGGNERSYRPARRQRRAIR